MKLHIIPKPKPLYVSCKKFRTINNFIKCYKAIAATLWSQWGIIDFTGEETRQIFSRMLVQAKFSESCLPLLEIE